MYRVGFPGWKVAARMGIPVLVRVQAHYDPESKSYWADSPDLDGLVVSGSNLDELQSEVTLAAGELLSLAVSSKRTHAQTELRLRGAASLAA